MIGKKDITGIILAGGKSSRMGTDKGLINFNQKAFVQNSISAMEPLVTQTMIVSNNPDYDIFKLKRVEDKIKDAGPLAGLYTGLYHSSTSYNLVLSCDIPLINTKVLEELLMAQEPGVEVVQLVSNHKKMPLIALYHKNCEHVFLSSLKKGERRVQVALDNCMVKNVILKPEYEIFTTNINTPKELESLENETAFN